MKKENIEKLKKSVKTQPQEDYTAYYDRYEEKFGHCPMIPRGTPLTDEDYDRYFPPVKPKGPFDTILY